MEVASGKGRRHAGPVGRDRGILGVSYPDLSLPGAGGGVDQDRFSSYLETAMAEMAPGIEDKRTLFSLRQLITALRAPVTPKPVQ
jgi:hypothetical protein